MSELHNIQDVVAGCISAKRDSQKALYQMFYSFSMAICTRYCSRNEDAVEVMNDGFVKIFSQLKNFTPRYDNYEASLKGWMKQIFIHTAIDQYRKNTRQHTFGQITDVLLQQHGNDSAIDNMTYKEIIAVVQKLSPAYRAVFNLYVIDGFKHEEIAARLNISVGTSKSNLFKAKMIIQKMLSESNNFLYEKAV